MTAKEQAGDERDESILAVLVARGGRRTASRRAIIEAMTESAATHPTAEEIARRVQLRAPDVNISTVYRTLESLMESGIIDHIHFGHGPAVYHVVADGEHHHIYCESCGAAEDVPADLFDAGFRELQRKYGFVADRRHFAIVGRCADCINSA